MSHLITLSVGTDTREQRKAVYSLLSDVCGEFALDYHYASVASVDTDRPSDGTDLFADAHTEQKAREAIATALETRVNTAPESLVTVILKELADAGLEILERRQS